MAEPSLHRRTTLDLSHDGRVVADAGVEAEVSAVDVTEADRTDVAGSQPVGQELHGGNRIVGHAECARKDIGAATREDAERSLGAGNAGRDLVERSVAAEADHDIDSAAGRVLSEPDCVSASVGLDHLDLVALCQGSMHDHGVAGRHR